MGASKIPVDRVKSQADIALLEEGGDLDEETMPDWMKSMRKEVNQAGTKFE